ncbi:hypothetical protein BDN67DRAFT_264774 [Paxillus ammoniavirescens]|nr:hypothetical protein BDN67DRAFT_264774 [Paxillus ammoniavirescens]
MLELEAYRHSNTELPGQGSIASVSVTSGCDVSATRQYRGSHVLSHDIGPHRRLRLAKGSIWVGSSEHNEIEHFHSWRHMISISVIHDGASVCFGGTRHRSPIRHTGFGGNFFHSRIELQQRLKHWFYCGIGDTSIWESSFSSRRVWRWQRSLPSVPTCFDSTPEYAAVG